MTDDAMNPAPIRPRNRMNDFLARMDNSYRKGPAGRVCARPASRSRTGPVARVSKRSETSLASFRNGHPMTNPSCFPPGRARILRARSAGRTSSLRSPAPLEVQPGHPWPGVRGLRRSPTGPSLVSASPPIQGRVPISGLDQEQRQRYPSPQTWDKYFQLTK